MECLILFGVHFDMFFSIESLVVMAGLLQHRLTDASVCPGQVDAVQPPSSAFLPHCNLVSLPWQEVQHGCSAAQAEHAPQFTRWHPVLWSELWAGRQAGGSDWKKRRAVSSQVFVAGCFSGKAGCWHHWTIVSCLYSSGSFTWSLFNFFNFPSSVITEYFIHAAMTLHSHKWGRMDSL